MGLISPAHVLANSVSTFSSNMSSSCFSAGGSDAFVSRHVATNAAASASSPGAGRRPPAAPPPIASPAARRCERYESSARKAKWRRAGLVNLAKSQSRNSPGSLVAAASVLNDTVFGCFACVTSPPLSYGDRSEHFMLPPSSTSNECGLQFFTLRATPSFSCVIPFTSENVTNSPSSNSSRSSSTFVTITVVSSISEMEATIPVCGSSPSASDTWNVGPKSVKMVPNTPRVSALMKGIEPPAALWQMLSHCTACSAVHVSPASTTTLNWERNAASRSVCSTGRVSTLMSTDGLRSCSFSAHAAARLVPMFASVR
mmetsp:Transcript_2163/g.5330  ORF Transcript_2163/g.5330 Transcript_2163/m.5330 type:complete len:314 (+) Transcript_2163:2213-3154(+)